jgi:hypothetical protein
MLLGSGKFEGSLCAMVRWKKVFVDLSSKSLIGYLLG